MTDNSVAVEIIRALPATIAAILGYFNRKNLNEAKVQLGETRAQVAETKGDVIEVGRQINGRMNEQLALTKKLSFAAGVNQEKKDMQEKRVTQKSTRAARKK